MAKLNNEQLDDIAQSKVIGLVSDLEATTTYAKNALSSGLKSGGVLSVDTDTTKFDVSAGKGFVVDNATDPENPVLTEVAWTAFNAQTVTNLATQPVTYVLINSAGAIVQQASIPDATDRRAYIFLGALVHSNNTSVELVNNQPAVGYDVSGQVQDLLAAMGFRSLSGNLITANGANLSIDKSSGIGFKAGANFQTDPTKPHEFTMAALTAAVFRYRNQDSSEGSNTTFIDPTTWDNGGTTTTITSSSDATIQHLYIFSSNTIRIQRGQEVFNNFATALDRAGTDAFIVEENIAQNGLYLGSWVLRKDCTDLTDTSKARFIPSTGITTATAFLSTLQQAYDVSTTPEILTDVTRGALTVKRGSGADTDNVFEVKNAADTTTFAVTGNGDVSGSNLSGTNTGDQDISSFETTTELNARDTANRARANHTGTQTASTISDFDTEVANNSAVTANTAKTGVTTQISNVVEDTSPQLGGNLDSNGNNITITDGENVAFGSAVTLSSNSALHGSQDLHIGGADAFKEITAPKGLAIEANTNNDASGSYEPYIDLSNTGYLNIVAETQGTAGNNYIRLRGADGVKIKSGGASFETTIDADSVTADRTLSLPNASGTVELEGHTHTSSEVTDFDTEVSNNPSVTANTAKTSNATHTGEVTGSTALTIADNVVDEANLKVSNAPTDDFVLTADSAVSGGLKWAAGGAGGSYTDEEAQDAVGTILTDTAEIDFTYNDATPSITASIVASSIDEAKLDASVNASLDLADSSTQPGDNISTLTNDSGFTTNTGDVVGAASSTDNAIVRFDSTTGKLIQNTDWTISDTGTLSRSAGGGASVSLTTSQLGAGTDFIVSSGESLSLTADSLLKVAVTNDNLATDGIQERTSGSGVTIDGVLLKDGLVDGVDVAAEQTRLANTSGTNTGDQDISAFETTTELNARDTANRARANHTGTQTASTISDLTSTVINLVYPVGSYYINETNSTNPGTLLGVGTWTAVANRMIVGKGSGTFATAGSTGGSENKTLTTTELPAHTHGVTDPGHAHVMDGRLLSQTGAGSTMRVLTSSGTSNQNTQSSTTGVTVNSAGSGSAYSQMNPYIVAYIWKRTA